MTDTQALDAICSQPELFTLVIEMMMKTGHYDLALRLFHRRVQYQLRRAA